MIIGMHKSPDKIEEWGIIYYNLHESIEDTVKKSLNNNIINCFLKSKIREIVKYYLNNDEEYLDNM